MPFVLYVETNFLMSVAMGREPHGDDLLTAISRDFRVVIPTGCYMEAFSAFEHELKKRNRFKGAIDEQISDSGRDKTSENAKRLLANLEQSRMDNDRWLNDIQERLINYIDKVIPEFEQLQITPVIVRKSVSEILISDPTDYLILHSILDDAIKRPEDTKVMLTGNTSDFLKPDVKIALREVGVPKPLTRAFDALGALKEWEKLRGS